MKTYFVYQYIVNQNKESECTESFVVTERDHFLQIHKNDQHRVPTDPSYQISSKYCWPVFAHQ